MIGVAIALFLTAAALTFVRHETRLLGMSSDRVDMIQDSRAALDLIANDLRAAGQGIGYDETGTYRGLLLGNFTVGSPPTSFNFNSAGGRTVNMIDSAGATWASRPSDIGVRYAGGSFRTVADWDFSTNLLSFCARDDDGNGTPDTPVGFGANDLLIIRDESGLTAETITLSNIGAAGACLRGGNCLFGCQQATWALAANQILSTGTGLQPSYIAGELAGGVQDVVYFLASEANGFGSLQRNVFTNNTCANPNVNCGGTVARGVEALQMQVYQWVPTPPGWQNVGVGPIANTNRLRVDLEMVVRAESVDVRQHDNIPLRLAANQCVPMPCGNRDFIERRVYRTSVEIKNAGFAQVR